MRSKNRVCKYSKCSAKYRACPDSIRLGSWKSHCCKHEHYQKWQIEVAYFRGEDISGYPFIEDMVAEGSLPRSVLPEVDTVAEVENNT